MISLFRKKLSEKKIEQLEEAVISASEEGRCEAAWENIQTLQNAQKNQENVAESLIRLVEDRYLPHTQGLEVLAAIYDDYKDNSKIVSLIGSALEGARDIDELNLGPPEHPLFKSVVNDLANAVENPDIKNEEKILNGLSTAARMMGRQFDSVAEKSFRRLVEIDPNHPSYLYSLGLYCKTRGLFKDGMLANQKALALVDKPVESYQWNLGICATGAGEGEIALEIWKSIGNKIEMGRFNLPEGGYPQCKVKLAQRPLAERNISNDDPGLEETIWIERLSPCHGIIRSVLYQDLGVDYGDVILMDGAPITYHTYGDKQIPVFPHLATLVRSNYNFFNFAATQVENGQVSDLSLSLQKDAIIYVHSENFRALCETCWQDNQINHAEHKGEKKNIVTGRIAAPSDISPQELLSQIDDALVELENCKIYSPELCESAGFRERAEVEKHRFNMLLNN